MNKLFSLSNQVKLPGEIWTDEIILFSQRNSPLSNLFTKDNMIKVDDISYFSSEQLFIYNKAKLFKDELAVSSLLNLKHNDPDVNFKIRQISRGINNYSEGVWQMVRYNLLYNAVKFKFTQNEYLLNYLISTNDRIIFEASGDQLYGISLRLKDLENRTSIYPKGKNIMGNILVKIREELK